MRLKEEGRKVLQGRLFGDRRNAGAMLVAGLVMGLLCACGAEQATSTPTALAAAPSPTLVPPTATRAVVTEPPALTDTPEPTPTPLATDTPSPVPATATPTQTLQPTRTPVPPTETPLAPTDTPVPPTDTPVPPTATPLSPTATPPPTQTFPPPTATPPPPPQFPWRGQVAGTFANCSLTRIMGLTLDRNGGIAGDIWVHFWADGWEGAWARSTWAVNEGYAGMDDSSNWDGVLDTRPKAGTWHACVVPGEASWNCISTTVTAQTTTEPCAPDSSGVQIVRIIFRQN